jgi:hypothetical protein
MSQIYRDDIPKVSTLAIKVSLPLSMYKDIREVIFQIEHNNSAPFLSYVREQNVIICFEK